MQGGCYVDRDLAFGSFGTDVRPAGTRARYPPPRATRTELTSAPAWTARVQVSCLQEHMGRMTTRSRGGAAKLYEGPVTGHFGERTQEAVAAWQARHRIRGSFTSGVFDFNTRRAYARRHRLPEPGDNDISEIGTSRMEDQVRGDPRARRPGGRPPRGAAVPSGFGASERATRRPAAPTRAQGKPRTCLDVCSDFNGIQDCKTRCVPTPDPAGGSARRDGDQQRMYHACRSACQASYGVSCDRAFPMTDEDGQGNFTACMAEMQQRCSELCAGYLRRRWR